MNSTVQATPKSAYGLKTGVWSVGRKQFESGYPFSLSTSSRFLTESSRGQDPARNASKGTHAMKKIFVIGFGLVGTLFAQGARAASLTDSSAGLKLLAGADTWSTPSAVPGGGGLGFAGSAGGLGYGALGYYELRIMKLIGIEADVAYQHGSFHRNVTYNQVQFTETVTMNDWRIPILAKLNIPLGLGRIWGGLGPEFTLSQSSSGKLEPLGTVTTRDVKPTFATFGLGLVVEMPLIGFEIPVEFRASKNLSQPSAWADRVTTDPVNETENVRAESSWVFRLGVGLGYSF